MAHAFIERQHAAQEEHHQSDDEGPEIGLHAVAERMPRIRGTSATFLPDQKQDLVAGIDQEGFGQHRGRSGNPGGDEFRERDSEVARERD